MVCPVDTFIAHDVDVASDGSVRSGEDVAQCIDLDARDPTRSGEPSRGLARERKRP